MNQDDVKHIITEAHSNPQKLSAEIESLLLTDWWELLEMTYLMLKYQNSCVFIPRVLEPVSHSEFVKLSTKNQGDFTLTWRCMDKVERKFVITQGKNPLRKIKPPGPEDLTTDDIRCRLVAPYALRYSMKIYIKFLKDCFKNKRMTIIPIALYDINRLGHANMLIYDNEKKVLERFEPHGSLSPSEYNPDELDKALTKFATYLDPTATYISPKEFCLRNGPQTVETITEQQLGTGLQIGSCGIWSLLYADIRLSKPDISQKSVNIFLANSVHKKDPTILHYVVKVVSMMISLSNKLKQSHTIESAQQAVEDVALWGVKKK